MRTETTATTTKPRTRKPALRVEQIAAAATDNAAPSHADVAIAIAEIPTMKTATATSKIPTPVPVITSIKITNVTYEDCPRAQAIVKALEGKSYMDLAVKFCPIGGSCDVMVETRRPDTSKAELTEMVLAFLCSALPQ